MRKREHGQKKGGATEPQRANLREALELSHAQVEAMLSSALACYSDGDLPKAAEILRGLVWLAPNDPRPSKLLGSTYLLLEERELSEDAYEHARSLDPDDPYTLVALAELKLEDLRFDEAVPLFERLFDLDPAGEHPAANRGRELVRCYYERMKR